MYFRRTTVKFPEPQGININMMPFYVRDTYRSLPEYLHCYIPMIKKCYAGPGKAYLTVTESWVEAGKSQRRPGMHTDGTSLGGWGGGSWGSNDGIFVASSTGGTRIWDCTCYEVDQGGALLHPEAWRNDVSIILGAKELCKMTDRSPHEAPVAFVREYRQFFRLVSDGIFGWFSAHSTPNPYGILPNAPIIHENKFKWNPRLSGL